MDITLPEVLLILRKVAYQVALRWGRTWDWEDFYGEMEAALAQSFEELKDKDLNYIITVCKNRAINSFFKGKSIDSKPRSGVNFADWEDVCDRIGDGRDPETIATNRIIVERIGRALTEREWLIWHLRADGETVEGIGSKLHISKQRVSQILQRITRKARHVMEQRHFGRNGSGNPEPPHQT